MKWTLTDRGKNRITRDWHGCFPEMGVYEPMHLLRRVGPLLIGIALERDSGNTSYRPTFHVHNLSRKRGHITLTLAEPLRTVRTGAPEAIQFRWHESKFREAAARLSRQAPLPFAGDVLLDDVLAAYRSYASSMGRYQFYLYEDMSLICCLAGRQELADSVIDEGCKEMKRWPRHVRDKIGDIVAWENRLRSEASDPARIDIIVRNEIQVLGAEKIPVCSLIVVRDPK
jgi:hypothetical protein